MNSTNKLVGILALTAAMFVLSTGRVDEVIPSLFLVMVGIVNLIL